MRGCATVQTDIYVRLTSCDVRPLNLTKHAYLCKSTSALLRFSVMASFKSRENSHAHSLQIKFVSNLYSSKITVLKKVCKIQITFVLWTFWVIFDKLKIQASTAVLTLQSEQDSLCPYFRQTFTLRLRIFLLFSPSILMFYPLTVWNLPFFPPRPNLSCKPYSWFSHQSNNKIDCNELQCFSIKPPMNESILPDPLLLGSDTSTDTLMEAAPQLSSMLQRIPEKNQQTMQHAWVQLSLLSKFALIMCSRVLLFTQFNEW